MISLDALRYEQELNPETFAVEYGAEWAVVHDPYLQPDAVRAIFSHGAETQATGSLGTEYHGYADPGLVDDHFAFVVLHVDVDDADLPTVVFDVLDVWNPANFPGKAVDTQWAIDQLFGYLWRFRLASLRCDQFNGMAIIDGLRARAHEAGINWKPILETRQTTRAENFQRAETFKRLTYAGRVSAPPHDVALDELLALRNHRGKVEAPSTGRVKKDDLAIAMINGVAIATEPFQAVIEQLSALKLHAGWPGGAPISPPRSPIGTPPGDGPGRNPYADQFARAGTYYKRKLLGLTPRRPPRPSPRRRR